MRLTYGMFRDYLNQIARVRKWEDGKDPDDATALTSEEFAAALIAGELTPEALEQAVLGPMDEARRQRIEKEMELIGGIRGSYGAK